jgi:hypothetical protein
MEQQAELHVAQTKYAPTTAYHIEELKGHANQEKLKDPIVFGAFQTLEKGETTTVFLQLYQYAKEGKTRGDETFIEINVVLADHIL